MAQHSKYWSCTKFADWVRGTAKLNAGTSEEWDDWTSTAQMKHNFRYWLAEEALDALQDFVTWPVRKIYDAKYYINNRWVTRTHSLTAHRRDIRPGNWCDVGNRFLPCLFNELVDFVEVEKAWMQVISDKEARAKYNPPFWATGWFRWRTWRSAQAGLDYLAWECSLVQDENWGLTIDDAEYCKPTYQAVRALELLKLYEWWTEVYPNRLDPYDASGWTAICEKTRESNNGKLSFFSTPTDPALRKAEDKAHKLLRKIEADYEKEDEHMMIRLIKIRNSLWT
jgi:hypothetical protein